jgi:hypothetical protein
MVSKIRSMATPPPIPPARAGTLIWDLAGLGVLVEVDDRVANDSVFSAADREAADAEARDADEREAEDACAEDAEAADAEDEDAAAEEEELAAANAKDCACFGFQLSDSCRISCQSLQNYLRVTLAHIKWQQGPSRNLRIERYISLISCACAVRSTIRTPTRPRNPDMSLARSAS